MKLALKPLEWGVFANEFALITSYVLIIGGMLGIINLFPKWPIAIYSLIMGVIVFVLEYPRGYTKEKFVQRKGQTYFVPFVNFLGFYGKNFYVRFIFYLCFSMPLFFHLPTFIGGASMFTAAVIYLKAALWGFDWQSMPSFIVTSSDSVKKMDFKSVDCLKETTC